MTSSIVILALQEEVNQEYQINKIEFISLYRDTIFTEAKEVAHELFLY